MSDLILEIKEKSKLVCGNTNLRDLIDSLTNVYSEKPKFYED